MGVKNSVSARINPKESAVKNNVSLNDYIFIKLLEDTMSPNFININWIVEFQTTSELQIIKEMSKIDLYNELQIDNYLRFLKLSINLESPFLIKFYHSFQDRENIYISLELMRGGNLSQIMKYHVFSETEAKILICCILSGLEVLHQNNMILSTLRPENILMDEAGYPKIYRLMDALYYKEQQGLVKLNENNEWLKPIEQNISIYLAPEVLLRQKFGPEADYYSLGVILYELMTQIKPIDAESTHIEIIDGILNKQIQVKKSELPEGWSLDAGDFINKLIQKNPYNRLGYFGAYELRKHNWLQSIDWNKINDKKMSGTFQPREIKIQNGIRAQLNDIHKKRKIKAQNPLLNIQEIQNLFQDFDCIGIGYDWEEQMESFQRETQQKYYDQV